VQVTSDSSFGALAEAPALNLAWSLQVKESTVGSAAALISGDDQKS
jgi:hypothetical protein